MGSVTRAAPAAILTQQEPASAPEHKAPTVTWVPGRLGDRRGVGVLRNGSPPDTSTSTNEQPSIGGHRRSPPSVIGQHRRADPGTLHQATSQVSRAGAVKQLRAASGDRTCISTQPATPKSRARTGVPAPRQSQGTAKPSGQRSAARSSSQTSYGATSQPAVAQSALRPGQSGPGARAAGPSAAPRQPSAATRLRPYSGASSSSWDSTSSTRSPMRSRSGGRRRTTVATRW